MKSDGANHRTERHQAHTKPSIFDMISHFITSISDNYAICHRGMISRCIKKQIGNTEMCEQ